MMRHKDQRRKFAVILYTILKRLPQIEVALLDRSFSLRLVLHHQALPTHGSILEGKNNEQTE